MEPEPGTYFDDYEYRNYIGRRDYAYDLLNGKTFTQTIALATYKTVPEPPKIDLKKIIKE